MFDVHYGYKVKQMGKQQSGQSLEVTVGFAADAAGSGVAYASVRGAHNPMPLRVAFRLRRSTALGGREVGYAAISAVAERVRERYDGPVNFIVADESLVADLEERRPLPTALTMPYVALRCRLNRFAGAHVQFASTSQISDLTARASAEASLNVAA